MARRTIQLQVRLDEIEMEIVRDRAAAWGITPNQYARLEIAGAPNWGMRRLTMTEETLLQPSDNAGLTVSEVMERDGFYQLDSGWWKHRDELLWIKVGQPDHTAVPA